MKRYLSGVLFAGSILALACAAPARARVYVEIAPPAAVVEVRPHAPGPDYYWVPGYHRWDGHGYIWVEGRWERPPHHRHRWQSGDWVHNRHHGWYWREGHWR